MLNFSNLRTAIHAWAINNSALNADEANQDMPRPNRPYLTLMLNSFAQNFWKDNILPPIEVEGEYLSTIYGGRTFTLTINSIGTRTTDVVSILEALRQSLQKPSVLEALFQGGIIYQDALPITDVAAIIDTGFQQMAVVDIILRTVTSVTNDVGLIEHVDFTGEVGGHDVNIVAN